MVDWSDVLTSLNGMKAYYMTCAKNASANSAAKKRFDGYVNTLDILIDLVEKKIS